MVEAFRPATPDDIDRLVELARQAGGELRGERGGVLFVRRCRPEPVDTAIARALAEDDTAWWVGLIDDAVIGYAAVVAETLDAGDELAVLTDLYVEPEGRGVGVGELLLDAAIDWAKARGCVGIDSVALPGMRDTKNFFEAAGLTARAITVHRSLR